MTNAWKTFETAPPEDEFFEIYGEGDDGNVSMAMFEYADGKIVTDCLNEYWRREGIVPLLWRRRSWPQKSLIAKARELSAPSWDLKEAPSAPYSPSKVRNDYPWFVNLSEDEKEARLRENGHA